MYRLVYSNPYLHDPLVWSNLDRKNAINTAGEIMSAFRGQNIAINRGSKKFMDCLLCYTKNDVREINEILK